jgi:hypothetical protein
LVGDSVLTSGTVVLHHVAEASQGEIDSTRVSGDGSFSFRLPTVPDPRRSEVYFAAVRHSGILYFGLPINTAVQLDSLYEIHVYDTLAAPVGGAELPVEVRNLFLEGDADLWQVTDLFQLRNDGDRTLVAPEGGFVWRYPLPTGIENPTVAQAEFTTGAAAVEDGYLVVRTPLPPGQRLFVVRYDLPSPFLDLRLPGSTETLEILVREPAPPMDAPGLVVGDRVEIEPGTTYRRFSGVDMKDTSARLVQAEQPALPPVRWFAVILGVVLGSVAVWAVQKRVPTRASVPTGDARRGLILEIARLDEAFEASPDPSAEERGAYEARRAELLRRLRPRS